MFTGIVQEIGTVDRVKRSDHGARVRFRAALAAELPAGGSVSVSGACLTAASASDGGFEAEVMNQTLLVTTLGDLEPGDAVNLEPPLRAGEPLGGHLVQGHVDGVGRVQAVEDDGFARRLRLAVPSELQRFVVERGSVAVDGVSLTVAGLSGGAVEVSLIPETLERTTLGRLTPGDGANLEVDVIARYAERLVQGFASPERTEDG
jgi:riboflavin synthase alpha subunit